MKFSGKHALGMVAAFLLVAGVAKLALSDDHDGDHGRQVIGNGSENEEARLRRMQPSNPEWLAECGACHIPYPPRFLPAESWREIMIGLDDHFGSDASLDARTAGEISAFLEQNARRKKTIPDASGKYPLRITDSRWFRREHARAASRVKDDPKLRNLANCGACHMQAESGSFSEHDVRYPF
ncbi:MAG TPA: diheme cytochrome c [Gallionella sp.]